MDAVAPTREQPTPAAAPSAPEPSPADDRHPGDVIRVVLGLLLLGALALAASSARVSRFEADLTRLLTDLPSPVTGILEALRWLGSLPAVAVAAVVALAARRPKLARDVVAA